MQYYENLEELNIKYQKKKLINPSVIVDVNHSNSNKRALEQIRIAKEIMSFRRYSPEIHELIRGLMIESYVVDGNQKETGSIYGQSVTDPCLGWKMKNASEELGYECKIEATAVSKITSGVMGKEADAILLAPQVRFRIDSVKKQFPNTFVDTIDMADYGNEGKIILEPDTKTLEEYQKKEAEIEIEKALMLNLKGKENVTLSGNKINIFANIGSPSDLSMVIKNDAGGIGLFRSEFIYLESDHLPSEEEQFMAYKQVAETMAGKKVIIRTLDIGADKQVDYLNLDKEENPALGYRAIRICLTQKEIFKTQLRAIFRASAYGKISIMYPMIISVDEVRQIKKIVNEIKKELEIEKFSFGNVEEGIMIETPAAALISEQLAKEVDFFSIGTNDLVQYTLALDRQNVKLEPFYDSHHDAVLKLIEMVVKNAHKEGIWAGICGELGADIELTEKFMQMGMDELSVAPSLILPLRGKIREMK